MVFLQVKQKKAQMGLTMDSSAALSAEIQESLERLAEKRELVQRMREEIDFRRHLHKQQLKDLKMDCDAEEDRLKAWNSKAADIGKAVEMLKEKREVLAERVEDEKRMEQEQKKMLEELEAMLKSAGAEARKRKIAGGDADFAASFSTLTEDSSWTFEVLL